MELPEKIFFTGVPGSGWSLIARLVEQVPGFNTSDRTEQRSYRHASGAQHHGAYFGTGMEFDSGLDNPGFDSAWSVPGGIKLIKSHEWAYKLNDIKQLYPDAWIMLVFRPTDPSYQSWIEAGGFDITYPKYQFYGDPDRMLVEIAKQNSCLLKFAQENNLPWSKFTGKWTQKMFGYPVDPVDPVPQDLLVTLLK